MSAVRNLETGWARSGTAEAQPIATCWYQRGNVALQYHQLAAV